MLTERRGEDVNEISNALALLVDDTLAFGRRR